jgi:hypothetical protein
VTGRSAAIQGGLAVVGLLAAGLTWQREPERAPGEVTVIDSSKADVPHIRFEDEANVLMLDRRSENGEPVVWVHLEPKAPKPPPPKADKKGDKAGPATPPPPPEAPAHAPRDVRGNADALKLIDRFAPLISPRAFGVMQGDKLKELGLDAPTRRLEVVVRGDTRKYDVGIALNAQNGEAFLRDVRDGRIYLMPRQLLSELSNGKRLVDPRLHTFETKEFDAVTATMGGKKREWIHLGRDNFQTDAYASPKTPDKHDVMGKNWIDSLWRTFPMEVLGKDEVPKGGEPKVAFRVDYSEKGKPVGWVEIARGGEAGGDGTSTSPSSESEDNIFARSEHSVGWARLHSGGMLISDAEKLFASP